MKIFQHFALLLLLTFSASLYGQKWTPIKESNNMRSNTNRLIIPEKYEVYNLDQKSLDDILAQAPLRFGIGQKKIQTTILLPVGNGKNIEFAITKSDVFHPDLSAKYPQFAAYSGYALEEPTTKLKLSISHKGMDAMIISDVIPTVFIDRYASNSIDTYIVYQKDHFKKELKDNVVQCTVTDDKKEHIDLDNDQRYGDCQLRRYRLALACTGEYATYHGGNIPDVLAEYNTSINRVNGIYEREVGITMQLIGNTDQLIFLNGSTDPYTNNDGGAMLSQNQNTVDQIIGLANYDIGHVYSTGGGGIASLRSPCTNRRARGVTGLSNPTGDPFWVDYVAHEMGHQYGGNHTFNNSCNENINPNTAFEPGSGSTIMAYAGICSPNVQNNSDDYMHSITQQEMANFVVAGQGGCGEILDTDNNAPSIDGMPSNGLILPIRTPFVLTGAASDLDGDPLSYCWEQKDNESATMPPNMNNTNGPSFRSYAPSVSPSRYFPRLNSILGGTNNNTWEVLTNQTREMNFTLTVRDNNASVGCTADEDVTLQFTNLAGPFLITSQNTLVEWVSGENQTITWDVANTDQSPISCGLVDILFSTDGGLTFDYVLASNTPNDGSQEIVVPFVFSTTCRVMVKCATSVFLDINNRNIVVTSPFITSIDNSDLSVCSNDEAQYVINYQDNIGIGDVVSFSITGLPMNASATFSPPTLNQDGSSLLTISNIANVVPGSYPMEIITTGASSNQVIPISMTVSPSSPQSVVVDMPSNGSINQPLAVELSWMPQNGILQYQIEISTSPSFATSIVSNIVNGNTFSIGSLESATVYYWRVRPLSPCFTSEYESIWSFQTKPQSCILFDKSPDLIIANNAVVTVRDTITISQNSILTDIEVILSINHTYIGDLSATLISPNGTRIVLFDQPGVPATQYGCNGNDIDVTFSTSASNTSTDFEDMCQNTSPAISGTFKPLQTFDILNQSNMEGMWIIELSDAVNEDGGTLVSWGINACSSSAATNALLLQNQPLVLMDQTSGDITNNLLLVSTSVPEQAIYTCLTSTLNGIIEVKNATDIYVPITAGGQFTQEDINDSKLRYTISDINQDSDFFVFDLLDENNNYLGNQIFNINYTISMLSIGIEIIQMVCHDDLATVTLSAVGGNGPYLFSIDGVDYSDVNVYDMLGPGVYTFYAKDASNNITSKEVTITSPDPLTLEFTKNGNIYTLMPNGGISPYFYSTDGVNYVADNMVILLNGITYTLSVKDSNGCIFELQEFTHYHINDATINIGNISCKGETTTLEILAVDGGKPPYLYSLDGLSPQESNTFLNVSAGSYVVSITDSEGNIFEKNIDITEPEKLLTIESIIDFKTITLMAEGGNPPYLYSINGINFSSNNVFTVDFDGTYIGYVSDGNGCIKTVDNIIISTNINEEVIIDLGLYPNPVEDKLYLVGDIDKIIAYEIYDNSGKIIIQKTKSIKNQIIDVDQLVSGVYFIRVHTLEGARTLSFVK